MMRPIELTAVADCPFSSVVEYAERFVADRLHQYRGFTLRLVIPFEHGVLSFGRKMSVRVTMVTELGERFHRHEREVWFRFEPVGWAPFPHFRAKLSASPEGVRSRLTLTSSYAAPGGIFGRIFDAFVGRFIARRIMMTLLRDVCRDLEHRHAAFLHANRRLTVERGTDPADQRV